MRTALFILALAPTIAFAQNANNPDCANAYPIAVSSGAVPDEWVLSNTGDEPNAISPAACMGNGYSDVWFSFVATASTLTVVHDGHAVDAVCIEAFSGTCGTLNSIGCTAGPISNGALPLTGLVVGNTYYFRSFQTYPGGGNTRRWGVVHPIANDECTGAMELMPSPNIGPLTLGREFTTIGATQSLPGCGVAAASDDDVWLRFTATAPKHTVVITTDLDVVVEAYSGSCGTLTSLWCEDNWVLDAELTGLTVGQEVFLRVYSESTVVQSYVWFRAGIGSPPANDECANAITIAVNEGPEPGQVYAFDLETATSSVVNNLSTLEDVWYSFTAPSTNLVVEKVGSFSLALFDANCVDGITSEGVYFPLVLDALVPGTTYKLKAGSGSGGGIRTRGFTTNDDCADAINLAVQNEDDPLVYTHAVTYGATESATACLTGTDDDVWFSFTATAPTILLSALADGVGVRYELNTGACGSLTAIECGAVDFNFPTALDSLVVGTNYTFRLWTLNASPKPLRVALTKTLSNDECAGAVPLLPVALDDFDPAQRTEFRYATSSMPQCGNALGTKDLWYSFTATAPTAALVLQPHYTLFDLSSEIFSGTCASLTSLLCTDELQTNYTGLVPGETYFVRIYTNAGGDTHLFNHQFYAPPANDDMADAIEIIPGGDAFAHPMKPFANYGASMSFPQPGCSGTPANDTWFYFVATNTQHAVGVDVGSLHYAEAAASLRIETFRGFSTIPDSLLANVLVCGQSANGVTVTGLAVGDTVMVRIYNYYFGPEDIRTFHPWVGGGGTSDEASGAVLISERDVYAVEFNTNNATQSLPSNGCGVIGDSPDDDIWFKFTHDGDAATLACHFLDNNAVLELFQGPVGSLTSIACGYNYLVLPNGMVDGQTYHLRVYSRNTNEVRGKLGIFHTPHPMESECADVDCLGPNLVMNPGIEPGELNATMFQTTGPPTPIGHGLAPHWHTAVATADSYSSGNDFADPEHLPTNLAGSIDLASDVRPRNGGGTGGAFAHQSSTYHEALGGKLSAPLVPGVPYLIAFNVRLRGNIGGCDGFGAHLSLEPVAVSLAPFNPPMQIEWQGGPINVTNEWQTICGQIIADQPYEHITIGVLKSQDEVECSAGTAYYYFDDVTVAEVIDALCVTVDVEEVDPATSTAAIGDGLQVFPNPASDRLNISIEDGLTGEEAVIELFDVTGKRVHARVVPSLVSNVVLELPMELCEGLYMVMVRVEGREPMSARVAVSR
ncbi:MAG: T9SS type A sorting domain-containing protein [Flavobacteriales bacterium]|nr:T9SS type A sorting domain-containing protein [Flavobacteriales bacterium]MBK9539381.1 T9SS type A sorting domain-containing protein [Flavobacteriales bacterium]